MNNRNVLVITLLLVIPGLTASAEGESSNAPSFTFKPVVIDSRNGTGSSVGVEYKFNGELLSKSFDSKDKDDAIDPTAPIGSALISYSGNGTIATSKERNPKNFIEFEMDGKLHYSRSKFGSISGGLFSKYETDQGFINKQFVYGLGATYGKSSVLAANDFVAIDANYGRVDPKNDAERKLAMITTPMESYYRWNLEFLYMIPIHNDTVKGIEFNYRYFLEPNAPAAIKTAGLEKHHFGTLRLSFKNDLFIAYSSGKLPFDKKNDHILEIGFSYKFN